MLKNQMIWQFLDLSRSTPLSVSNKLDTRTEGRLFLYLPYFSLRSIDPMFPVSMSHGNLNVFINNYTIISVILHDISKTVVYCLRLRVVVSLLIYNIYSLLYISRRI